MSERRPVHGGGSGSPARVAAIDLGKVRVGIAVSDELGVLAHPRPHLDGTKRKALLASLAALARDEGVTRFLVGLPLDMIGSEGPPARRARDFAAAVAEAAGVEVELVDERLTTVEASRALRDGGVRGRSQRGSRPRVRGSLDLRDRVDSAAAAVLLQSWLDAQRAERDEP